MADSLDPFVAHVVELLAPLGTVRTRRMFGGWGISCDGLFIALIVWERLFLKVDATTKPQFQQAGCEPFVYQGKHRPIEVAYWTVPAGAMDAPHLMAPWARLAMQAALTAANAKPKKAVAAKKSAIPRRARST